MKKKIAILGSTGSIGTSTLEIIKKDKFFFDVVLLSANNNYKKLIQQAKIFKTKNVLIKNIRYYEKVRNELRNTKTRVYAGNVSLNKIISGQIRLHHVRNCWCSRITTYIRCY